MLVPLLRRRLGGLIESIASRLPPHPNVYTLLGLLLTAIGCAAALQGMLWEAIVLYAAGAAMDALDGAVARLYRLESRRGALLDSVCDRVADALLALGLAPIAGWPVVYLLASSSIVYSYVRARAESLVCEKLEGLGILERGERLPLILLAYILAALDATTIARLYATILAIAVAAAAGARTISAWRLLERVDSRPASRE